jgi:hypothetical protein
MTLYVLQGMFERGCERYSSTRGRRIAFSSERFEVSIE